MQILRNKCKERSIVCSKNDINPIRGMFQNTLLKRNWCSCLLVLSHVLVMQMLWYNGEERSIVCSKWFKSNKIFSEGCFKTFCFKTPRFKEVDAAVFGYCLKSYLCKCYETRAKKGQLYGEIMECQLGSYEVRIGKKCFLASLKRGSEWIFHFVKFLSNT